MSLSKEQFAEAYTNSLQFTFNYLKKLGAGSESEEWAQAAWARAWEKREQFRGDAEFSTWVMVIARNLYLGQFRKTMGQHAAPHLKDLISVDTARPNFTEKWMPKCDGMLIMRLTDLSVILKGVHGSIVTLLFTHYNRPCKKSFEWKFMQYETNSEKTRINRCIKLLRTAVNDPSPNRRAQARAKLAMPIVPITPQKAHIKSTQAT